MTHIAVVKLAPGQCGFYDDLSGTHLSLINKEAKVMQGVNTAGLVTAVKIGKITVVSGSLGSETSTYKKASAAIPTYYRLLEKKAKQQLLKNKTVKTVKASEPVHEIKEIEIKKAEEIVQEEVKVETIEAVPVKEEIVEVAEVTEVIEVTEVAKKKTRKKKATATEEVKED